MEIWIVNLKRRSDRRKKMEMQCAKFGIKPQFFDAIDGNNLRVTDEIAHVFAPNDFHSNGGAIGCALSHLELWRKVPSEGMIILEDDATIVEWAPHLWPTDADLLFLGFTSWHKQDRSFLAADYVGGTFGYVISQRAAHALLKWVDINGCTNGIDYLMVHKMPQEYVIKSLTPHVVRSEWVLSPQNGDTDIQGTGHRLDLFANWEYIDKYDHLNDDFWRVECPLREASKNNTITAFNKLGFLKTPRNLKLLSRPQAGGIWLRRPIRIQVECNWCSSQDLCAELQEMKWPVLSQLNYQFISNNHQIDFWLIINSTNAPFDAKRAIYLRLEPWSTKFGAQNWGQWAHPQGFLTTIEPIFAFWQLSAKLPSAATVRHNRISIILSEKYNDPGHKFRVDFIRYIEEQNDPLVQIDVFGRQNYHNLRSYRGPVTESKETYIYPWAFYLSCENIRENNYISEKFWEPVLCGTMPLYWGCLNIDQIVPPGVCKLTDEGFPANFAKIKTQILFGPNHEWLTRTKNWILSTHTIFHKLIF